MLHMHRVGSAVSALCNVTSLVFTALQSHSSQATCHHAYATHASCGVLGAGSSAVVSCSIARHPDAFKYVELAQITSAFRMMRFRNPKLNAAVEQNVLSLPEEELTPTTATNLLRDLGWLGCKRNTVFERLVRLYTLATCRGSCLLLSFLLLSLSIGCAGKSSCYTVASR